jgi:hypothetical protein
MVVIYFDNSLPDYRPLMPEKNAVLELLEILAKVDETVVRE